MLYAKLLVLTALPIKVVGTIVFAPTIACILEDKSRAVDKSFHLLKSCIGTNDDHAAVLVCTAATCLQCCERCTAVPENLTLPIVHSKRNRHKRCTPLVCLLRNDRNMARPAILNLTSEVSASRQLICTHHALTVSLQLCHCISLFLAQRYA